MPSIRPIARLPILLVLLAAGCTMPVPGSETWGPPGTPGDPGGTVGGPQPGTGSIVGAAGATMDRICRTSGMRGGWIATSYVAAGDACPIWRGGESPYNAAVIERHEGRPVGSRMTVCADQRVPRGWVRETQRDARAQCPGARVADGRPTTVVMRRQR